MVKYEIKTELFFLANYIEKITPKCSAADFFIINRTIVGPIFSTCATYLIITIQFNLSETPIQIKI